MAFFVFVADSFVHWIDLAEFNSFKIIKISFVIIKNGEELASQAAKTHDQAHRKCYLPILC